MITIKMVGMMSTRSLALSYRVALYFTQLIGSVPSYETVYTWEPVALG